MLPMADDRSHNNDNDTTATPPAPNLPAVKRFFRLQNDLMAAHPLQVGSCGMRHDPSSRSSWFRAVCAAPWRLSPVSCPTVRQSVRLHNIIFHIVRSLACHFLHYATVSPLRQAGRVGSSSGLIPKSKPNPQHNLQALLNPAPNVINLRTEVCI